MIVKKFLGFTNNSNLHIGHYILFKKYYKINTKVFIANLHSICKDKINLKLSKEKLKDDIIFLKFLGVKNKDIIIQNYIADNLYIKLVLIFSRYINYSDLKYFHAVKNLTKQKKNIYLSHINYVVFMCVDLFILDCNYFITAKDQIQHIEIYNSIIKKINSDYDLKFNIIKYELFETILDGKNNKMSKSLNNTIDILGDIKIIKKQIYKFQTTTEFKRSSNIINIYFKLTGLKLDNEIDSYKIIKDKIFKFILDIREKFFLYKKVANHEFDILYNEILSNNKKYNSKKNSKINKLLSCLENI